MPPAWLIFAIAGPLFLLMGLVRCLLAGRLHPQARTWLIVGVMFSIVALWLRTSAVS